MAKTLFFSINIFITSFIYAQGTMSDVTIEFDADCHYSGSCNSPGLPVAHTNTNTPDLRSLKFDVNFDSSCEYDLGNGNQTDWNKVMRISPKYVSAVHHNAYNTRLGWRWDLVNEVMNLGMFLHVNHPNECSDHVDGNLYHYYYPIKDVALNTDISAELLFSYNTMVTTVDDKSVYIRDDFMSNNPVVNFFKTAYFGGDEKTPHAMTIDVSNIERDYDPDMFLNSKTKLFYISNFTNGDTEYFYAEDLIVGSAFEQGANPTVPFMNIEQGAEVHFRSDNEILLKEGFHAKNGSVFHAKMGGFIITFNPFNIARLSNDSLPESYVDYSSITYTKKEELVKTNPSLENVTVYPNPTRTSITVTSDNDKVLINSLGQILFETKERQIDMRTFNAGMYYLKVGEEVFKVIKE